MASSDEKAKGRMEILVVGPEPPCVRCINAFRYAADVAKQFTGEDIEVRKIFARSEEARKYGRIEGGHDIAEIEKVDHNSARIQQLMAEINQLKEKDEEKNKAQIDAKLEEIDKELIPIKKKAEETGYLVTPVLLINGQVKAQGYVPTKAQIKEWIEGALVR